MTLSSVQRQFFATHVLLQPAGAEISALLAAGIEPHRVLSLYPLDMVELPALLQGKLHTAEQIWQFATCLEQASQTNLVDIYDDLTQANWELLSDSTASFFYESKNFNAMADQFKQVQQGPIYPRTAYSTVSDALLSAASILWLGANWISLPELHACEAVFCEQLAALRELLLGAAGDARDVEVVCR